MLRTRRLQRLRVLAACAAVAAASALLWFFGSARFTRLEEARSAFGAIARIEVLATDRERAQGVIDRALAALAQLERDSSLLDPTSELARLNRDAAHAPIEVSFRTFRVISESLALSEKTFGAVDVTALPLMKLWGFYGKSQQDFSVPKPEEIKRRLANVGWRLVRIESHAQTISFAREGVELDLTAAARAYACDLAVEFLAREPAVKGARVEIGGVQRAFGKGPRRGGWPFEIRHPRDPARTILRGELRNEAVSWRSDSSAYFLAEGKRYPHLLDPRTGYPAALSVQVIVFAPSAFQADGLSAAFFVLRRPRSVMVLSRFRGVRFISLEERAGHLDTFSS